MVQRQVAVASKLGIKAADHVKSERRSANFKPFSTQHPEGKGRGADVKKKMKKFSRSIKLSDLESLASYPSTKKTSEPGKPPPTKVPAAASIQQKQQQSPFKSDSSPNYMKSTSCFNARKEKNIRSAQTSPESNKVVNTSRRNSSDSKECSAPTHRPTKSLTRTSSLELVRTLTKAPTFKPARASARNSSRVLLYGDTKSQKATCSSTLKDTKFPEYLTLNPGGTESEGTSLIKVCPFTYCSLNGHRHASFPPLKRFLSARRRLLKTQKSLNSKAQNPRKIEPSVAEIKELDASERTKSQWIQEVGEDFLIEVYAKSREGATESAGGRIYGHEDIVDHVQLEDKVYTTPEEGNDGGGEAKQDDDNEVAESLSDGSPISETGLWEKDGYGAILWLGSEFEREALATAEVEDVDSEDNDMDWQEGQFSCTELDARPERPTGDTEKSDLRDDQECTTVYCNGDITAQMSPEEASLNNLCFELQFDGLGSGMESHKDHDMEESSQVSECLSYDQISFVGDAVKDYQAAEENREEDKMVITGMVGGSSEEEPTVEQPVIGGEENHEKRIKEVENVISEKEAGQGEIDTNCICEEVDDCSSTSVSHQYSDGCQDFMEIDHAEANDEHGSDEKEENEKLHLKPESFEVGSDMLVGKKEVADDASLVEIQKLERPEESLEAEDRLAAETGGQLDDGQGKDTIFEPDMYLMEDHQQGGKANSEEENTSEVAKETVGQNTKEAKEDPTEVYQAEKELNSRKSCEHEESTSGNELKSAFISKKLISESEELGKLNLREPNFLPLLPDPEAEKVDLKHQMMDDRKNAEEWMLDYALQKTVTKLAPARKKKVALLVEAFESVMPIHKCDNHLTRTSAAFAQPKPIQACF